MRHHPDKGGDTEHFVRLQEAYATARSEPETSTDDSNSKTEWLLKLFKEYVRTLFKEHGEGRGVDQRVEVRVSMESMYEGDVKRVQYKRRAASSELVSNVFYLDLRTICAGTHVLSGYGDWNDSLRAWSDLCVEVVLEPSAYWMDDLGLDDHSDLGPVIYTSHSISVADYFFGVLGTIVLPNGNPHRFDGSHIVVRDGAEIRLEGLGLLQHTDDGEYQRGAIVVILNVDMKMAERTLLKEDSLREMFPNI